MTQIFICVIICVPFMSKQILCQWGRTCLDNIFSHWLRPCLTIDSERFLEMPLTELRKNEYLYVVTVQQKVKVKRMCFWSTDMYNILAAFVTIIAPTLMLRIYIYRERHIHINNNYITITWRTSKDQPSSFPYIYATTNTYEEISRTNLPKVRSTGFHIEANISFCWYKLTIRPTRHPLEIYLAEIGPIRDDTFLIMS